MPNRNSRSVISSIQPPEMKFSCGHTRDASYFARRTCPACTEAKRVEACKNRPRTETIVAIKKKKGRLPDKTKIKLTYDAKGQVWIGYLRTDAVEIGVSASGLLKAIATALEQYSKEGQP